MTAPHTINPTQHQPLQSRSRPHITAPFGSIEYISAAEAEANCSYRQPQYGRMSQMKRPPEEPGRFNVIVKHTNNMLELPFVSN